MLTGREIIFGTSSENAYKKAFGEVIVESAIVYALAKRAGFGQM